MHPGSPLELSSISNAVLLRGQPAMRGSHLNACLNLHTHCHIEHIIVLPHQRHLSVLITSALQQITITWTLNRRETVSATSDRKGHSLCVTECPCNSY